MSFGFWCCNSDSVRPFLSRRAFHDHQVEGSFTRESFDLSSLKASYTFSGRCLKVCSLLGNTYCMLYIYDIYGIFQTSLFLYTYIIHNISHMLNLW